MKTVGQIKKEIERCEKEMDKHLEMAQKPGVNWESYQDTASMFATRLWALKWAMEDSE